MSKYIQAPEFIISSCSNLLKCKRYIFRYYTNIISYNNYNGFIVYNHSYGVAALANTIFGFNKGNPLLEYMIENITHKKQWIGPNWWSQVICKYIGLNPDKSSLEQLIEKLNNIQLEVVYWKDIEDHCFRHEALASWIHGSTWNNKLKTGNYD